MALEEYERVFDMDDHRLKGKIVARIGALTGLKVIGVRDYKPTRSNKQLGYWYGVVVETLRNRLQSDGQHFSPEEVHDFLLDKFAAQPVVDPESGELLGSVGKRSSKMDTAEFSEFVEKVREWMDSSLGEPTPDPSVLHGTSGARERKGKGAK